MKTKILALFMALLMCLSLLPVGAFAATVVDSGYCGGEGDGTNLTWTLDSEGTLTISGTGEMENYSVHNYLTTAPWREYCEDIYYLIIEPGVTTISEYSFYNCSNLIRADISDTVTFISFGAFEKCSALSDIIIPDSVNCIGGAAFEDCIGLKNIHIPNNVGYIEVQTFSGCRNIESVVIGDSVDSIEENAFQGCTSLVHIEIPNSVTRIGRSAFEGCTSLAEIIIPESVTYIEDYAFYGCTALSRVDLPDTVETIMSYAFSDTAAYNDDNNWLNSCLYLGKHLIKADRQITSCEIIDGTISIADDAFSDCSNLVSVDIPDSVEYIGNNAFSNCGSLSTVSVGNSVKKIGSYAFYNCRSLPEISLPESLISIGEWAFYDCASLVKVTLPDSVLSIENNAFYGSALYNDSSYWTNEVLYIGSSLISAKKDIVNCEIVDGTKNIGRNAFAECKSLSYVSVPSSVSEIGTGAFSYCSNLNSISLSEGLEIIGAGAFSRCEKLSEIQIPNTVHEIGFAAFYNSTALSLSEIPESVTRIGANAFYGTATYSDTDNWENGVLYIGKHLIKADDNIVDCEIKPGTICIANAAFQFCSNLNSVLIPQSVMYIGVQAFYSCGKLSRIILPDGIKNICSQTFMWCTSLKHIRLPYTVSIIENDAFSYCYSLGEVTYCGTEEQKSEVSIGIHNACLTNAMLNYHDYVDGICTYCGAKEIIASGECGENLTWALNSEGTLTISGTGAMTSSPWTDGYSDQIKSVVIEDGATSIADLAFSYCGSLEEISIPEGVISIGESAFSGCELITSIDIPDSVTYLGEGAFQSCESLESVTIGSGLDSIPAESFSGCTGLKEIDIPENVKSIGRNAFSSTVSLEEITLHEGLERIEDDAFLENMLVKTVFIPSSVSYIGLENFGLYVGLESIEVDEANTHYKDIDGVLFDKEGKKLLTYPIGKGHDSYTIPGGVEEICFLAFAYAGAEGLPSELLKSVTIPSSVQTIGFGAFFYCNQMTDIYYMDTEAMWNQVNIYKYTDDEAYYNYSEYDGLRVSQLHFLDAHEHSYTEAITTPATCTTDGVKTFTCSCGDTYTETIPAFGHTFEGGTCTRCGAKDIIASGYCGGDEAYPYDFESGAYTNLRWELDSEGKLTISGTGEMKDYGAMHEDGGWWLTNIPWRYVYYDEGTKELVEYDPVISVVITEGVTSIGFSSFSNCNNLCNVSLPTTLTNIEATAFHDCNSLASIIIPESVTSIKNYTFESCDSLTNVTISNSVTTLGNFAFCNCESLKGIEIPDSVTSIGDWAFSNCYNMTDAVIGCNAAFIGDYAFNGCTSLTSILIPDSVTSIGDWAFCDCSRLKSIVIPDSVTELGRSVFLWCEGLESVQLGSGIERIKIDTFSQCYSLKSVEIPDSVKYIEESAFATLRALTELKIGKNVESIGRLCFADSGKLTSIAIPASVKNIDELAFALCTSVESITVEDGNTSFRIVDGALYSSDKTRLVCYPAAAAAAELIIPEGVTHIDAGSVGACANLTTVTIPESIEYIGGAAFALCPKLEKARFEGDEPTELGYVEINGELLYTVDDLFTGSADGFTIYAPAGNTTWTDSDAYDAEAQTWHGYPIRFYEPVHTHTYTSSVIAPTCTEMGYTKHSCEVCGDSYRDNYTPALGHDISSGVCTRCSGIPINVENFPDNSFRAYVGQVSIDKDGNKFLAQSEIADVLEIDVSEMGIINIDGIRYFTYLETLDCSENSIKKINDALPAGLRYFDCSGNSISYIPTLPSGLEYFNCSNMKQLNGKFTLPAGLKTFICENDNLASFPVLPTGLETLDCSGCELSTVQTMPAGLKSLDCSNNSLRTMKFAGTESLEYVNVGGNKIADKSDVQINHNWDEVNFIFGTQQKDKHTDNTAKLNDIGDKPAEEIMSELAEIDGLKDTLENDETAIEALRELEEKLGDETDVNSTVVSFDVGEIKIIGASLNEKNSGDNKISLTIGTAENVNVLPEDYGSAVTFSMKLDNAGTTPDGKLKVPVVIKLPVPDGLDASMLVILHYHEKDGDPVTITPSISLEDGRYYATFVLDSFSDFAMAEHHEHQWIDATCSEARHCASCNATEGEPLDTHAVVTDEAVAASCTADGYTAGSHCSVCGKVIVAQKRIAAGHSYTAEVIAPTCTQRGYTVYTCTCNDSSYTDNYVDARHTPAAPVRENEVAATHSSEGSYDEVVRCSVCGEELSRETHTTPRLEEEEEGGLLGFIHRVIDLFRTFFEKIFAMLPASRK